MEVMKGMVDHHHPLIYQESCFVMFYWVREWELLLELFVFFLSFFLFYQGHPPEAAGLDNN